MLCDRIVIENVWLANAPEAFSLRRGNSTAMTSSGFSCTVDFTSRRDEEPTVRLVRHRFALTSAFDQATSCDQRDFTRADPLSDGHFAKKIQSDAPIHDLGEIKGCRPIKLTAQRQLLAPCGSPGQLFRRRPLASYSGTTEGAQPLRPPVNKWTAT